MKDPDSSPVVGLFLAGLILSLFDPVAAGKFAAGGLGTLAACLAAGGAADFLLR
jgi:hypothetical protein